MASLASDISESADDQKYIARKDSKRMTVLSARSSAKAEYSPHVECKELLRLMASFKAVNRLQVHD